MTYGVAKEVARILKSLTGNIIHHVTNSRRNCKWHEEDQTGKRRMHHLLWCFCPIYIHSSNICHPNHNRTSWNKTQNSTKEQPYLPTASWSYWNSVYITPTSCSKANCMNKPREQLVGSPLSPIVANLYMESFEHRHPNISYEPS